MRVAVDKRDICKHTESRLMEPGTRVYAIVGTKKHGVEVLGEGTYVGDAVPVEAVGWMAEMLVAGNIANPKIELDNGGVGCGCECWWGPVASAQARLEGQTLGLITVDEMRTRV